MHPMDDSISSLLEDFTVEELVELLRKNIEAAGFFDPEYNADASHHLETIPGALDFLPSVLNTACGCDADPLIKKLLEAPIIETVAYLEHMMGEFSDFCQNVVIGHGINTKWKEYLTEEDYERATPLDK